MVLHVWRFDSGPVRGPGSLHGGRRLVEAARKQLAAAGIRAYKNVRAAATGDVAHVIADAGNQWGASLVVVGAEQRPPSADRVFGSVADHLIARTADPVLVVLRHRANRLPVFRRILLAVAGIESSTRVVEAAEAAAKAFDAEVGVLHAPLEPYGRLAAEPEQESQELLDSAVETLRRAGARAREIALEPGPHLGERIAAAAAGLGRRPDRRGIEGAARAQRRVGWQHQPHRSAGHHPDQCWWSANYRISNQREVGHERRSSVTHPVPGFRASSTPPRPVSDPPARAAPEQGALPAGAMVLPA